VVDSDNKLVKPGDVTLDKAVHDELLSLISFDNPRFKDWDASAVKYTKKPLPAGPDGHPIGGSPSGKPNPSAPIATPSIDVSHNKSPQPSEDADLTALRDPVERDRTLAIAKSKIEQNGSVLFDGKEFKSAKALTKYVEGL
jgi:hypothetical protein